MFVGISCSKYVWPQHSVEYGLGTVLSHKYPDRTEKLIAYASRTSNKNEINYSQVDKEGALIIFVLKILTNMYYGIILH